MKNRYLIASFFAACLAVCLPFGKLNAQVCNLVCHEQHFVSVPPGEQFTIRPDDLLESVNNCPAPIFSFSDQLADSIWVVSGDNPFQSQFIITELGSENSCWGWISVSNGGSPCLGDTEAPVFDTQPGDITFRCNEPIPAGPILTATDNCSQNVIVTYEDRLLNGGDCGVGLFGSRIWTAVDENLNTATYTQRIYRNAGGIITWSVPADLIGECGQPLIPDPMVFSHTSNCAVIASTFEDVFINTPNECSKILRTWTFIDWCSAGNNVDIEFERKDLDGDNIIDAQTIEVDLATGLVTDQDGNVIATQTPSMVRYLQIIKLPFCDQPTALCRNINTDIQVGQTRTLFAEDFNWASYDGCVLDSIGFNVIWADSSDHTTPPTTKTLTINDSFVGDHNVELWITDDDGNSDFCTALLTVSLADTNGNLFNGRVFSDTNKDCLFDDATEDGLEGWIIQIEGFPSGQREWTGITTDVNGNFSISMPDQEDTLYQVSLISNINYGQNCPTVYEFDGELGNQVFEVDIPVVLEGSCPLLAVDISASRLLRCFTSTYVVNYCNYGAVDATDAYVDVELDAFVDYNNATMTPTTINGNSLRFDLGDVPFGKCGFFSINVTVSCDAQLGQNHCSSVHIYPDSLCQTPQPWSGATIEASAACEGDSVRLKLHNTGKADMPQSLDYIIIEDVVMYRTGNFNIKSGDEFSLGMVPNGSTWTIRADQEPFHPNATSPTLSVEGCVVTPGDNFSTGVVAQFSQRTGNGFEDIDCQENVGSFDPNDKAAAPLGYGPNFQIEENTLIDYKIRFQNTGTDTAFSVRIEDQLDEWLDLATIKPGAASHPYSFQMTEDGMVQFLFENIFLPDSTINEPASNGFVNFSILPKSTAPRGTIIRNTAAIYFDFNDPVITNEVTHQIGIDLITVSVNEADLDLGLQVYPNPFHSNAVFKIDYESDWQLHLYDLQGRLVRTQNAFGNQLTFERQELPQGVYYFKILTADNLSLSGKLVVGEQ